MYPRIPPVAAPVQKPPALLPVEEPPWVLPQEADEPPCVNSGRNPGGGGALACPYGLPPG